MSLDSGSPNGPWDGNSRQTEHYEVSTKELNRAVAFASRRATVVILLITVLALAVGLVGTYGFDQTWTKDFILGGVIGVALGVYMMFYPIYFTGMWRRDTSFSGPSYAMWNDTTLRIVLGRNTRDLRWTDVIGWRENQEFLVFRTSSVAGNFIPKRAFKSESDLNDLRTRLANAVATHDDLFPEERK